MKASHNYVNEYTYQYNLARQYGGYNEIVGLMTFEQRYGMDSYLSFRNCTFRAKTEMVPGTNYMRMTFKIWDEYDFRKENYSGGAVDAFATFINNRAADFQNNGVINYYQILAYPVPPDTWR